MNEEFHPIRDRIINKLEARFHPASLTVEDDSHLHIGHAGHNGKGESHFTVRITAAEFSGKSRIDRHRMVYAELGEMIPPIHALRIFAESPSPA